MEAHVIKIALINVILALMLQEIASNVLMILQEISMIRVIVGLVIIMSVQMLFVQVIFIIL